MEAKNNYCNYSSTSEMLVCTGIYIYFAPPLIGTWATTYRQTFYLTIIHSQNICFELQLSIFEIYGKNSIYR